MGFCNFRTPQNSWKLLIFINLGSAWGWRRLWGRRKLLAKFWCFRMLWGRPFVGVLCRLHFFLISDILKYMGVYEGIWNYLKVYGGILRYVKVSEGVWRCTEYIKQIPLNVWTARVCCQTNAFEHRLRYSIKTVMLQSTVFDNMLYLQYVTASGIWQNVELGKT